LRQAFDKPVVLVQEVDTPAIFDIAPLRYTEYHSQMLYRQVIEDQENITTAITATAEAIKNSKSINSIVKLLSLTHTASLTNISESDKDTALLQMIMAELSNIKTDIAKMRTPTDGQIARSEIPIEREIKAMQRSLDIDFSVLSLQKKLKLAREGERPLNPNFLLRIQDTRQLISVALKHVVRKTDEARLMKRQVALDNMESEYFALQKESENSKAQSDV
jgi:hypothetical protein